MLPGYVTTSTVNGFLVVTGTTNYTVSQYMFGNANGGYGNQISDATYFAPGSTAYSQGYNTITCSFTSPEIAVNNIWTVVTATLVLFMQAGFAMLEVGSTRMKNAGAVMGKILVNVSITWIMFWLIGWNLGFSRNSNDWNNNFVGNTAFNQFANFIAGPENAAVPTQFCAVVGSSVQTQFFFQVVFCCVSVAIIWGTMLDRTKFIAYIIFATIFSAFIYPVVAHWTWGGGWLYRLGYQDFAGSSIVHLQGAVAAFAGTVILGPRIGRFDSDGRPMRMVGHSLPLQVLGVFILWIGWMGFNPGSFLGAIVAGSPNQLNNFADVAVNTNLAAAAGCLGSLLSCFIMTRTYDVNQMGNGAIGALVAITSPCAFVDTWGAVIIGLIAGLIVPPGEVMWEKLRIDDPINCLTVHGLTGIWGTFAAGLFSTPARAAFQANNSIMGGFYKQTNDMGFVDPLNRPKGHQLGIQIAGIVATIFFVYVTSTIVFLFIHFTVGLRAPAEHEEAGLDISEHGAFGYPERFIKVNGVDAHLPLSAPTHDEMKGMNDSLNGPKHVEVKPAE